MRVAFGGWIRSDYSWLLGMPISVVGKTPGTTYSRRFVELLCTPRTRHSRLRVFSMTLLETWGKLGRGICGTGFAGGICGTDGTTPLEKSRRRARQSRLTWPNHADIQLTAKRKRSLTLSRLGLSLRSTLLQSKARLCLPSTAHIKSADPTAFSLLVLTARPHPTRLFLKKSRTSLTCPVQSRSENALAACRCACCDESQPVWPGIRPLRGIRASSQQTSGLATGASRAMSLPPLCRNEQPHWTSPNFLPRPPWRRAPDLAPYSARPPRGGTRPEGMNSTGPAKRDRCWNASRSGSGQKNPTLWANSIC